MLSYELCKQLKEAGFPKQKGLPYYCQNGELVDICSGCYDFEFACHNEKKCTEHYYVPTLSELIEACGDSLLLLQKSEFREAQFKWIADGSKQGAKTGAGSTPEEAVCRLYLELNKKV